MWSTVCACVCHCACLYMCQCVCMCACVCMYACMYACMYVCIYVCMHVCMHVCYMLQKHPPQPPATSHQPTAPTRHLAWNVQRNTGGISMSQGRNHAMPSHVLTPRATGRNRNVYVICSMKCVWNMWCGRYMQYAIRPSSTSAWSPIHVVSLRGSWLMHVIRKRHDSFI